MRDRDQSSGLSEKALLRMETQLKSTTLTHPIRPVKNMATRMFLLQSIRLSVIAQQPSKRGTSVQGTGFVP